MFTSNYFGSDYFGEYFKVSGTVTPENPVDLGGGGGKRVNLNWQDIKAMELRKDEAEIMEFIAAFVLSR